MLGENVFVRMAIASCAVMLAGCESGAAADPVLEKLPISVAPVQDRDGRRLLGLAIGETGDQSYDQAVQSAISAGVGYVELVVAWDDVETAPGVYAPDPDWALVANGYYPATGLQVTLSFLTIDTTEDRRPDWMQAMAWDHPDVIEGAWRALARTLDTLRDTSLVSISLGNEVDIRLGDDHSARSAFISFAEALETRLDAYAPSVPVGVKTSAETILNGDPAFVLRAARNMDVAMITYYPLDGRFRPRGTDVAAEDFARITAALPGKPIHLAEIGYPSSDSCGSSLADQAEFVRSAFAAWDRHADRIPLINWVWQTDVSSETVDFFQSYYGLENRCFAQYLATLGLRDRRARPKPGWAAFVESATARNLGRGR